MVTTLALRPPLVRTRTAVLGGVCGAVSRHLGWGIRRTRWLTVALALCGGAGALLYLWLWALVPLETADDATPATRTARVAIVLDAIATLAVLGFAAFSSDEHRTVALLAVTAASAAAVGWSLGFDRGDPARTTRYRAVTRVWAVVALAAGGIGVLVSRPSAINAVLGVGMLVIAVAVFAAPRVVSLWSDLLAERATRARQEQRAEIAAHLHDSVLQTLALIQNRAGASSEVARIARAQERELRDWLFAGDDQSAVDLAAELRDVAAAIELDYPVRIEFVTAGDTVGHTSQALVAAAREAMLNAARHAGGSVSVYLESSPEATDVFVRDRGPGVDLAGLPADRLGIRESIIGRMSRAGGTATVAPGAGGLGTEVHLRLEATHA